MTDADAVTYAGLAMYVGATLAGRWRHRRRRGPMSTQIPLPPGWTLVTVATQPEDIIVITMDAGARLRYTEAMLEEYRARLQAAYPTNNIIVLPHGMSYAVLDSSTWVPVAMGPCTCGHKWTAVLPRDRPRSARAGAGGLGGGRATPGHSAPCPKCGEECLTT